MKIKFICNFCNRNFTKTYSDGLRGRGPTGMEVRCPHCKELDVEVIETVSKVAIKK